jgi:hypothetical protein
MAKGDPENRFSIWVCTGFIFLSECRQAALLVAEWRKTLEACLASMERASEVVQRSRKEAASDENAWPPK